MSSPPDVPRPVLEYEHADLARARSLRPLHLLGSAVLIIGGFALAIHAHPRHHETLEWLAICSVLAGIFWYFAEKNPVRQSPRTFWRIQLALATALALWGALWFISIVNYEPQFWRYWRDVDGLVPSSATLVAGIAWFIIARIGERKSARRALPSDLPEPLVRNRHRLRVWMLFGAVFALIGAIAAANWLGWQISARRHYNARAAELRPPNSVVYSEDPDEVRALLARGDFTQPTIWDAQNVYRADASHPPVAAKTLGNLFSHQRTTGQLSTLIEISLRQTRSSPSDTHRQMLFTATVIRAPTLQFPNGEYVGSRGQFTLDLSPDDRLRIFAPRPDPRDQSRFFIPYEIDGQRARIDARLNPDATVSFSNTPEP